MKISNVQRSEIHKSEYNQWKAEALAHYGFFPVFQPFKESFLLRNLSGNALKLYIYLGLMSGNHTGECWVTIETVSKYFDKSKRAVSIWIKELEDFHLIERYQLSYNNVSHTYIIPYGLSHMDDENSLQKGERNHGGRKKGD